MRGVVSLSVQYSQSSLSSRVISACPSSEGLYQGKSNKYSRVFLQLHQLPLGIVNSSCLRLFLLLDHCQDQCGQPHKHEMCKRMAMMDERGKGH